MGDQAEWAFQQQLIARMQQQQADEDDEAERAWQAALAAQGGSSSFGSGLLDPKGKSNQMPASLANVFQPPTDEGLTQEEIEEEAERAWREALALQGGDEPMDEEAERAWQEALELQQEELDLKDDEYYEELYRNTRINEGNKVNLEKEIIDLNEQRWKLRDKKAEYYSGMKDLMESSKALDVLRGTARTGKPLKGILKKRLERVKIDRRLTLRMTRSPIKAGIPRKRVGFILPEEVDAQAEQMMRMKNQEVEKLMSKSRPDDNEEEFLEMSLQFIQDFKEEEERLKQESEEIKRMEEQVARLEAELAREGIALAQKYNSDNNHTPAHTSPIKPQPKQQPDALEDAKNADLPARIKRGTKGFGGVFIDEVHKMLGEEELQKIEARIAGIPQEDAEDIANEGEDDEEDNKVLEEAADPALSARIKRGTKGFGGVFIEQVHRMLEEEKKNEAANGTGSPPVPHRNLPVKPGPAGAKPAPTPTTKPAPAAGTGMKLQLDKINKEEEQRRAAEAAARKEEDDRKNQERLKQAAEARKILVSPRPATLPSTSPRGATPPTPVKPQPTTSPRPPVPTPTNNNNTTSPPARGGTTNTTQPPATTPSDPKKPWSAPAPTPRYGTSNPPSRPERSLSDPGSPKPPPAGGAGAGGAGVGGYSSTAQRLEAKQAPPAAGAGSGIGGRPSPPQPTKPALGGSAPAGGSGGVATQPTQPPSPRKGLLTAAAAPATNGSPKFYGPKPGAGSFIIKRTPTTPPAGTIPLATTTPSSTTPTTLAPPPSTTTNATSPTSPRAAAGGVKPGPVKPLNHPEPVKRGVARPSNIDPTISAKANFFEQKQHSAEPVLSEEVLQRRARLEMFKTKVLAKNGQDNLKSPRVNS